MKTLTRTIALSLIVFGLGVLWIARPLRGRIAHAENRVVQELPPDAPQTFNKLSGAARSRFLAVYGKDAIQGQKPTTGIRGPGGDPFDDDEGGSGLPTDSPQGGGPQPPAPSEVGTGIGINSALPSPLVNNPGADATSRNTQSETSLLLASGSNVVSSFNDSGSFIGSANKFTGFSTSSNMGTSWTDKGALPTNTEGDAGDPVLARDNVTGKIYFSTLGFTTGTNIQVFRSTDEGNTYSAPVNATPGYGGTADFQDKEWIAVDNFAGPGQGNVYLAWRNFNNTFPGSPPDSGVTHGIRFTRSTDGGSTWGPNQGLLIASEGAFNVQGAYTAVGTDHSVYVFYLDNFSTGIMPGKQFIKVAKSTDQGVTFGSPVTVATLNTFSTNGGLGLNGGLRSNSFPQAAVNPSSGNLYVVYNDATAAVGGDRGNIFFKQSTDGGATWSGAAQLNTDGTTRDQFFPAIAVKPDGSGLAVSWYDRRRDASNLLIERWGSAATISGATITPGPDFRIGGQFPVVIDADPVINTTYMGDYDQMAADNSFFYTTWGDNGPPSQLPCNQPDVRFAKIPMAGPGPVIDVSSSTVSGGNGNGFIDPSECNNLTVNVINDGTSTATGISAVLSTTTPGVTITQANSTYPDLASGASGANNTAFMICTSECYSCGTPINLTLTVTYTGGSDAIAFNPPVCACPAFNITSVLGSPTPGTGYTVTTGTQNGRIGRDSRTTFGCKTCPGVFTTAGARTFDAYTFTNPGNFTAKVTVTVSGGGACSTDAQGVLPVAYSGSFNPASLCTNYLGDPGVSTGASGTTRMILIVPAGTSFVLDVHAVNPGGTCAGYNVTVNGLPCAPSALALSCPANQTATASASCPIANGTTVTFPGATGTCGAATCSPASGTVFPVGTTTVTCSSTADSCQFTVTVFSFCLQDDSSPGNVVLVNAQTGDFSFCCGGVNIASGRGTLTTRGCIGSIDASKGDRQVHIQWDTSANNSLGEGTAYVQKLSNKTICQITDKNMSNNTCQCGSPPPTSPKKPPKERTF